MKRPQIAQKKVHLGFPGKSLLSVGASLAARFQTRIKNVFTTEITESMEESDCFKSVISVISVISVTSVVKLALLLLWEVQLVGRMLLQTRACCQNLRSAS